MSREYYLFQELDNIFKNVIGSERQNFPPHNIIQTGDLTYEIVLALAGYSKDEITVDFSDGNLTVSSILEKDKEPENKIEKFLHRGIAKRAFRINFTLSKDIHVVDASFDNGLLTINLERIIPDELKPRKIEIKTVEALPPPVEKETLETNVEEKVSKKDKEKK